VARTVAVIGIEAGELESIRMLVSLLRHADPHMPALAKQALVYLQDMAKDRKPGQNCVVNQTG
jgi:hypothetical protein